MTHPQAHNVLTVFHPPSALFNPVHYLIHPCPLYSILYTKQSPKPLYKTGPNKALKEGKPKGVMAYLFSLALCYI
jgi:hypothetical protein